MSWSATHPYDPPGADTNGGAFEPSSSAGQVVQTVSPSSGSDTQVDERQTSNSSGTSTQDFNNKDRATVPSACVQCRSKHLKCDGSNPCSRCSTNSFDCAYVKSRRGFKGPRKNAQNKTNPNSGSIVACPLVRPAARNKSTVPSGLVTPPESQAMPRVSVDLMPLDISQDLVTFEGKTASAGLDMKERCIEAFYYHFYPAHPFVLPRSYFMKKRKERSLSHLEAAMRYIGSFYVSDAPKAPLGLEAERAVYDTECPEDGFRVQALLILAIGLDGYTLLEKALQIVIHAQDLALKLGMNTRDYARLNGDGLTVLEESWRRTWWELYIADGMIAGVHQKSTFRLNEIQADALLPCEEKEYLAGRIPSGHTIDEFGNESFDDQDVSYSSFTYRIAAIRNLGRVLSSLQYVLLDQGVIDRVDAHLVNWKLHLPDSKRVFITSDGILDEMLFQAHMITNASMILLHRELSQLDSSIVKDVSSCAPHKAIIPGENYNVHAAKTIQAAQEISKLISLPVPLVKHTHFFTCVVTLASIVHLSVWSMLVPVMHDEDLKQQLRLNTGALKSLWQVWPSAGKAFGQVKGVAQEIYATKKQAAEVGYWANFANDDVMQSMIEDRTIMEELQLL